MGLGNSLQLVTTFAYADTFVVSAQDPVGFYLTHALYMTGTAVAWLLGYRAWYKEYTPARYHAVAAAGGKSKVKILRKVDKIGCLVEKNDTACVPAGSADHAF